MTEDEAAQYREIGSAYLDGFQMGRIQGQTVTVQASDEERIFWILASIVLAWILGSLIGDALLSSQGKFDG
jgi:hypothetical protein